MSADDAIAPLVDIPAVPVPAESSATTVASDAVAAPAAPVGNHFERRSQNARGGRGGGRFQFGYSSTKPDNDNWNRGKRERSNNAEGGEQGEDENDDENDRVPKRKVCLMIGYSGLNYSGLQVNSNANTIEKALEQAIFDAKGLMPENRNFTKIHWSRACRTDKGVHAAANVISLKMNALENAAEAINAHLPQDIRVFDVYRVSKGFNSWKECTERRYEYSMPSYCLQPLQQYLTELIGFSEQQRTAFPEQYLPEIKMPDQSVLHPAASSEGEVFNASLFCPSFIQRYAPFPSTFRLSEADKERLNMLLHKYTGTHSFHNFTIRRKSTDSSTNRFIKEVKAVEYFMHDNVEFVRILVHGQSFMLHQIRKMVGFVCAIMRGLVPESEFDRVFDRKHLFIAPMAPAEGLFLDRCYFQRYNIKLTREKSMADRQPMTWDALDEKVELFKRQQIHPVILHQSHEQKAYTHWLVNVLDRPQFWVDMLAGSASVTSQAQAAEESACAEDLAAENNNGDEADDQPSSKAQRTE